MTWLSLPLPGSPGLCLFRSAWGVWSHVLTLREALYPYPASLHIVAKVGSYRDVKGGWIHARSPKELHRAVHDNLINLGLDVLDVVNLRVGGGHDGHSPVPGSIAEPFTALAQLQQEGWSSISASAPRPPSR